MKVYISGKIGDLPMDGVEAKFELAESLLSRLGHDAVNPLKCHDKPGVPCPNPSKWTEYMLNDIAELFDCDAILMLNDWKDSPGAKVEKAICEAMGKAVWYQDNSVLYRSV